MIAIVDYGMGNLRSVLKAFEKIGAPAFVSADRHVIKSSDAIVLPGVGAFRDCMENLKAMGLIDLLRDEIEAGKPYLGICLGLQILFTESEEFGKTPGLNILRGSVKRFSFKDLGPSLKIPHMGWNKVRIKKSHPILDGLEDGEYFYFVHSYYVEPDDSSVVLMTSDYGREFVSAIAVDNIVAVQFHPEKSQKKGLRFLSNFIKWIS